MRSTIVLFAGAAALALVAEGACSSDTSVQSGSTSASSASSTVTTGTGGSGGSPATATSSTASSGGGGAGGVDNDSFATAKPIALGSKTDADLTPTGDADYYSFQGKKDQPIYIATGAELLGKVQFDPTYIDTIVTLYAENHSQIARDQNAIPQSNQDSRLMTILPADGTYYIRVAECWTDAANPASTCLGTAQKTHTKYQLFIRVLDPVGDGNTVADLEKGDDIAGATPLPYVKNQAQGYYYIDFGYGTFRDESDVDVYSFTLPADTPTMGHPAAGYFYFIPSGPNFDGSTTPFGDVWIADAATPNQRFAYIDGTSNYQIHAPLVLGNPYYLFIKRPPGANGAHDFYFFEHYSSYTNLPEMKDAANDAPGSAEVLGATDLGGGETGYFVTGAITSAGVDLDHYLAAVPAGLGANATVGASCAAQRYGSGLRGLKVSLLLGDGTPVAGASATESATQAATSALVPIPPNQSNLMMKVEATSQDPAVTSNYYMCGVYYRP